MSDQSVIALAAVITSGVLGLAGLGFNFWNSSSERKHRLNERREDSREWYRRTLFERRVAAVHEAASWLMELQVAGEPHTQVTRDSAVLASTAERALQWYFKNCFYIHGGGFQECPVGKLFVAVYDHTRGYGELPNETLWGDAGRFVDQKATELLEAPWRGRNT